MGTQFKNDCPHCLTKAAGFSVVFQWPDRRRSTDAFLVANCGLCNNGIIISSRVHNTSVHPDLEKYQVDLRQPAFSRLATWPERSLTIPDDLPSNVENFFLQGLESLKGQRWDAAGAMFRKALDVATKIIAPQWKGKNLFQRIELLVEERLLTEAMGAWSHEIRIDGNDAVHDEEPETEDDAKALQRFTEAFLTYAFSLPSLVARNREKRDLTPASDPA